jgi:phosphoglycolate phosphatase
MQSFRKNETMETMQNSPSSSFRSRKYDLIAFDWDGTLYDSTAIITQSIQRAVGDVGGTVPSNKDAAYVIGMGLEQALAHAAPDVPHHQYAALGERYRYHYASQQEALQLFDGVLPMLHDLRMRQHWLAVATGKSRYGLNEVLRTEELKGVFHSSRTADETRGKPHPQMLQELMEEFSLPPQRVLMVGDTSHDLLLAKNAGCDCVAVSYGAHATDYFQPYQPCFVASSVPELHRWLLQNA